VAPFTDRYVKCVTTPSRTQLLDAGEQLFYTRGITRTGVDAVAEAAGVTKPTLYAQFGRKSQLVAAVLERRHERRRAELDAWLEPFPPAEQPLEVLAWLRSWYAAERNERGCAFLNAAAELPDPEDPGRIAVQREKSWLLERLVGLCHAAGLTQPETLGSQLLLLVDGLAGRAVVGGPAAAVTAADHAYRAAQVLIAAARS